MPTQAPTPPPAPATPSAPVVVEAQTLAALQAQAVELVARLAGLRTEQRLVQRQISRLPADAPLRTEQIARMSELNAQVARAEGQLSAVRAEVAQRLGLNTNQISETAQPLPPPPFRSRGADPDMVVGMSFVLAMCFVLPLSIAWAKRIWRGRSPIVAPKTDELAPRMDRLEHAVDAIAIEIERVSEGQRFVTRLLTEGSAPALSVGQKAAEPVRVPDREALRASREMG